MTLRSGSNERAVTDNHHQFSISVSHSQIAIFDRLLDRPFNEWTRAHLDQGFSWRPGSVSFRTLEEAGEHNIAVFVNSNAADIPFDAVRVIEVPFEVPPSGAIELGSIADIQALFIPAGLYQLRFECYALANSPAPRVRFVLDKNREPKFGITRADSALRSPKDLLLTASPA